MASFTISPIDAQFPEGTSVSAYTPPTTAGPPNGTAKATATVASNALTFTNLVEGLSYQAIAQVGGAYRRVTFYVPHAANVLSGDTLATTTPAANTMLAGGAPLHVNPVGSPGIKVTPEGDVLFGTNELIHGGSTSTSSASWDYQQSAFDGLYSALNKRWYMRSLIMAEVGDPPDLIIGRYGPNNAYPMGLTGDGSGLTGVGTNTSLGKLSFRGAKTPSGGTVGVTGNAQMSGSVSAIYGRAAENLSDTAQGGHLIFQTTATTTATVRDVARFNANGNLELGGNFDTNLYSATANVLKTDDSFHVTLDFRHLGANLGFYNHATATQQTVTGSRGANAALASLLTALAATGLIVDGSS